MTLSRLFPPTLLLALSALFSRLLGVWRDHLLARYFGAGAEQAIYNLDAYYAAFRIPDLLYNLIIFGAVSAAFIPLFTQYKKEGKLNEAWQFASNMLHLLMVLILFFSLIAYFLAPFLTQLVAPGFSAQASALTTHLMRILLISPVLFTFSAIFISLQDSFKTFFYRSLAPLLYNAGIIAGIVFFGQQYGVMGVAWGVILGAALQLIIQLPALRSIGFRHMWIFDRKRQDVQKAFRLLLPRVLGLSLNQLTLFANTVIASLLATGSITVFYFADNLQSLPLGMIGIAFAITSFATLSELAMEKGKAAFASEMKTVMQKILFLIIPASLGLFLFRWEIIDLLLVSGRFTPADGVLVSHTLSFLLLSLFAQSLLPVLTRGFYAYHNTKTPLLSALLASAVSVSAAWFLSIRLSWGVPGIAAGFSAGMLLNGFLLYFLMARHCQCRLLDRLSILKMLAAAGGMFVALWFLKGQLSFPDETLGKLLFLILLSAAGALVYFGLARLLKVKEMRMIWGRF